MLPKPAAATQPRWKDVQTKLLAQYPQIGVPNSAENQTYIHAFQAVGRDPSKALAVARAVFGR